MAAESGRGRPPTPGGPRYPRKITVQVSDETENLLVQIASVIGTEPGVLARAILDEYVNRVHESAQNEALRRLNGVFGLGDTKESK